MSLRKRLRATPRRIAATALVTGGLAGGIVLGSTMSAGAATTATTSPAATPATSGAAPAGSGAAPAASGRAPAASGTAPAWGHGPGGGGYRVPGKSGTVTAVGTSSVTISGTTYAVTSASDIDKNGEATLADLKVGDAVTFDTLTSASTPTIDKLHAGSEALDRPTGGPGDGGPGGYGGPGGPPQGGTAPSA